MNYLQGVQCCGRHPSTMQDFTARWQVTNSHLVCPIGSLVVVSPSRFSKTTLAAADILLVI